MKKVVILLILFLFSACTDRNKTSEEIYLQLKESNWTRVDFSKTVPFPFERVCIFGTYSTNEYAQEVLGFNWDMEAVSDIKLNEGINLITFIKNNEVIYYIEQPRSKGDFWKLSGKCLNYKDSKITRASKKSDWIH